MNPAFDPAMMQKIQQIIQQNPQLAMLLQKPGVMEKFQAIASNPNDPTIAQQYMSDPDIQQLISILGPALGMNQSDLGGQQNMQGGAYGGGMMGSGGLSGHVAAEQIVTDISDESHLMKLMAKTPKTLIVCDFYATWCGPCNQIKPEVHRLARLYQGSAVFVQVDVDRNKAVAQKYKVSGMPTFVLFLQHKEVGRVRGANSRKLEDEIAKHVSASGGASGGYNIGGVSAVKAKASPYTMFPLARNNRPIYTKAPFKRMKGKLMEINTTFREQQSEHALSDSEWQSLADIMAMLQDKKNYDSQKFSKSHYALLDKLLQWPSATLPPVLDLIRVMALHPQYASHLEKDMDSVLHILKTGGNGEEHPVNGMLTCRIVINLFNRIGDVLRGSFGPIVHHLLPNMMVDRKNTRIAFVRVLLHYSYCFYVASYQNNGDTLMFKAEKLRCLSLLMEVMYRETEPEILLNIMMGIGTLLFRDENVIEYAAGLEIEMLLKSYRQKCEKQQDIVKCCDELLEAIKNPEK